MPEGRSGSFYLILCRDVKEKQSLGISTANAENQSFVKRQIRKFCTIFQIKNCAIARKSLYFWLTTLENCDTVKNALLWHGMPVFSSQGGKIRHVEGSNKFSRYKG